MDGQYAEGLNAPIDCAVPSDSVIWVNIFDPINGPSFKPSPLKSIPLFMQRPAVPIIEPQRQASAVDAYLQSPLPLASLRNSVSCPSTLCPTPMVSISRSSTPNRAHSRAPSEDMIGDAGPLDIRRQQAPAFIKEEALKRPSSRLAARHRRSQTRSSLYQTPPEYMDQTPSFHSLDETRIPAQKHPMLSFPTHSSEYLERYQPLSTPATRRLEMLMEQSRRAAAPKVGKGRDEEDGVRTELRKFFGGR